MFSIDFSQLKGFVKDVKQLESELPSFYESFLLEIGLRLIDRTKKRTPVDIGTLRRNWRIGKIKKENDGDLSIEIINDSEYASFVENGHRGTYVPALGVTMFTDTHYTEGRYMLKISTEEIRQQVPLRLRKSFDSFLTKHMK